MEKLLRAIKDKASNPKVLAAIGVTVAGIVVLAAVEKRRRSLRDETKEDFGAFVERLEILPFPQPPPPAAAQPLSGLTFAVQDRLDINGYVTGFGNLSWEKTHEPACKTAVVLTALLKNGATCVGKTVMGELGFGITGENMHYGTPIHPKAPSYLPGGSSSGSAVAVAAKLADFAFGIDTTGDVRIPAAFCGLLGYRPSHGVVSIIGVLPGSQSLDAAGCFARDPSILHRVGYALLQLNSVEPKRARRLIFANDLFELSKISKQKTEQVVCKAVEKLSGYQPPKHLNFGQYIASNVSSLKGFCETSTIPQNGTSTLKALSSVMISLQRYEFKTNHEEWIKSVKPKLAPDTSDHVLGAINTNNENIKMVYKVRTEVRAAIEKLLKLQTLHQSVEGRKVYLLIVRIELSFCQALPVYRGVVRLPFHWDAMKAIPFPFHSSLSMEPINFFLIRCWICSHLSKSKPVLLPPQTNF